MNRILIIQTAFLGDVILATPVIEELNRLFPTAKIDFLVKKGNEQLLEDHPKLNQLYVFNKSERKYRQLGKLLKTVRRNKYDLSINLHRFGSSGLLTAFSGAKLKYGFKKNPWSFLFTKSFAHSVGDGTHEVERNLSLIADFGAEGQLRPVLYPSRSEIDFVQPLQSEDYVCIAPSSVWFTKQLPAHKWIELIRQLLGVKVYLIGGPGDKTLCDSILDEAKHPNSSNLCGQLNLMQSVALIKGAKHAYVNDSGPMHMASAVNTPTTAFFCSTIPNFGFGPLADHSTIKEVMGLDCRPCGLHGHKVCPKGHFDCGNKMIVT